MDDMINRHNAIAEENLDPKGRPAIDKFGEWSEDISGRTDLGYEDSDKPISDEEREKRLKEMEEIVKKDLE